MIQVLPRLLVAFEADRRSVTQARHAFEGGADGVFLVAETTSGEDALVHAADVIRAFPGRWVGLNRHDEPGRRAFADLPDDLAAVWTPTGIRPGPGNGSQVADHVHRARKPFRGLFFGDVAGTRDRPDLLAMAALYADVCVVDLLPDQVAELPADHPALAVVDLWSAERVRAAAPHVQVLIHRVKGLVRTAQVAALRVALEPMASFIPK